MKHMLTVAAAMLLLAASQAPGAAAARFRGLTQFNNLNNGFVGFNNGFGISQSGGATTATSVIIIFRARRALAIERMHASPGLNH